MFCANTPADTATKASNKQKRFRTWLIDVSLGQLSGNRQKAHKPIRADAHRWFCLWQLLFFREIAAWFVTPVNAGLQAGTLLRKAAGNRRELSGVKYWS